MSDKMCCYLGCTETVEFVDIVGFANQLLLTARATNALKAAGIVNVQQLRDLTFAELMRLPNVGKLTAKELFKAARAYPDDVDEWWSHQNPLESSWPWRPL
jgi:DNA-directed RNA polymerase alpha subunit